jgi:hypothetical protein
MTAVMKMRNPPNENLRHLGVRLKFSGQRDICFKKWTVAEKKEERNPTSTTLPYRGHNEIRIKFSSDKWTVSINTRSIEQHKQRIRHERNARRGARRDADCHELAGLHDALNR